ncbi:MAG: putative serine/threonine-protein kinase isoform [Gammaproteobacteria bacterium]|jgi:TPR repeat protein/serine/threonine protein kinase|nr:putative serine/threonine-protein kinase isoform [Gammaproteobacteria bacterium]
MLSGDDWFVNCFKRILIFFVSLFVFFVFWLGVPAYCIYLLSSGCNSWWCFTAAAGGLAFMVFSWVKDCYSESNSTNDNDNANAEGETKKSEAHSLELIVDLEQHLEDNLESFLFDEQSDTLADPSFENHTIQDHSTRNLTERTPLKSQLHSIHNRIKPGMFKNIPSYVIQGIRYRESKEYQKALRLFQFAAQEGYARGWSYLVGMYVEGKGLQRNQAVIDRLIGLTQQAAQGGDPVGEWALGDLYYWGWGMRQNKKEAIKWYRNAVIGGQEQAKSNLWVMAHEGISEAQCVVGKIYLTDSNIVNESKVSFYGQARFFLKKAIQQNHQVAHCYLGLMYEYGLGVEQSIPASFFFYAKADIRFPLLQVLLGVAWLRQLKNCSGVLNAEKATDLFTLSLQPDEKYRDYNYQLELVFFEKQAEKGQIGAQVLLAIVYIGGLLGTAKDEVKAVRFLEMVKQSANAWTQWTIGQMYENGLWFRQDYEEAILWYTLAATKGLKSAERNLCVMYQLGHGVRRDIAEAEKWKQLADKPTHRLSESPSISPEPLPNRPVKQRMIQVFRSPQALSSYANLHAENVIILRVLYDWKADRDDRLSIHEGEILYVLRQDGDWWHCENQDRQEGMVPRNFVEELALQKNHSTKDSPVFDLPATALPIKECDVEIIRELGNGAFGVVYHALWIDMDVALKKISASNYSNEEVKNTFWLELHNMSQLRHPNIVSLCAYTTDTTIPFLVMEFMNEGTLFHKLGGRKKTEYHHLLEWEECLNIAINIANGMYYLHNVVGMAHRDLKSENVLLCHRGANQNFAKIADFGLSKLSRDEKTNTLRLRTFRTDKAVGTLPYMAPELLVLNKEVYYFNYATDVYSFAFILWELLTHKIPYNDSQFRHGDEWIRMNRITNHVIMGGRQDIPEEGRASTAFSSLIKRCWAQEPNDRPSMDFILDALKTIRKDEKLKANKTVHTEAEKEPDKHIANDILDKVAADLITDEIAEQIAIGPRAIPEFNLAEVNDNGNCFYQAAALQMKMTNRPFLARLNIPEGTQLHDSLRLLVQGEHFNDREWANINEIYSLAERSNSIVAIIDTRYPHLGFRCYFIDTLGERQETYHAVEVPSDQPIIRLAYTGDHYLSVRSHPVLGQGALRESFNGEIAGDSTRLSSFRLSINRYGLSTQLSSDSIAANQRSQGSHGISTILPLQNSAQSSSSGGGDIAINRATIG